MSNLYISEQTTPKKCPISDVGASSSPPLAKSARISSRPPIALKKTKPTPASVSVPPRPLALIPTPSRPYTHEVLKTKVKTLVSRYVSNSQPISSISTFLAGVVQGEGSLEESEEEVPLQRVSRSKASMAFVPSSSEQMREPTFTVNEGFMSCFSESGFEIE